MADMKARIMWIGNKRADSPPFVTELQKNDFEIEIVSSGPQAIKRVPNFKPDLIVVNASSLHRTGKNICHSLRKNLDKLPIILIVDSGQLDPNDEYANLILELPFTVRKLLNRIMPYIPDHPAPAVPSDEKNIIHVGHLRLDLKRRHVRFQGKKVRLTPRLTRLLQILMQHPGEVIEREHLFREVWNTKYTGDTRTLDVHISWLRKAIEEDPRKPRFLKTIRRVGYRLDVS
jgi:DNA-binding response OmpR family regulator